MGKLSTVLPGGTHDNDEEEVSFSEGVPGSTGATRAPAASFDSAIKSSPFRINSTLPAFPTLRHLRDKRNRDRRSAIQIGVKIPKIVKAVNERAEWERAQPKSSTSSFFGPNWTKLKTHVDSKNFIPSPSFDSFDPFEDKRYEDKRYEDNRHEDNRYKDIRYEDNRYEDTRELFYQRNWEGPKCSVHNCNTCSAGSSNSGRKVARGNTNGKNGTTLRWKDIPRSSVSRRIRNVSSIRLGQRSRNILFGLLTMSLICLVVPGVAMPPHDTSSMDSFQHTVLNDFERDYEDPFPESDTNGGTLSENELEIIRRSIVQGLGLQRIPDPSKANVSQSAYERAHREYLNRVQQSQAEHGTRERRSLHVFHAREHPGNRSSDVDDQRRRRRYYRHSLFFPVEIPDKDVSVDHASLRFLLDGHPDEIMDLDALIFLRTPISRELLFQKKIQLDDPRNSKWLEFDSTDAVSSWLQRKHENLELELEFRYNGEPVRRNFSSPVLNVFTASEISGRRKRSSPEELMSLHKGRRTKCKGENKKCCRHELTVMFKDLKGFEFIVYPKTFDAGYCKGRCPPRYNPAHHHALLQSLLWKEDRKKVPKPCCAPSKLDQLMIVYFDENDATELKVSYWKNIQVLECACS